ncbi:MAG: insulinase family protein [candidate division Zixibacteria bacterium]|nr:insulinase family protein [Candidatus Tariuqbacter arcticus]
MLKKLLSLIFILTIANLAFSEEPLEKRTLHNGMTLITQEDHSRDIVAICTYVNGGARTETPELSGLSHYFEHLIFRGGTSKQAELEMRKKFKALGTFYGYTFEDGTCYYIVVPKENLPEALDRYCDVLLNLEITQSRVETERGIILEEFSQSYFDVPHGMTYYNLYQTAYTNHPYGQTVIGDSAVVRKANMEVFQKFYDERYTPDQFVTAAVGDFNTRELTAEIEKTFGKFPAGGMNFELGKIEPPQGEFRQVNHHMPVSKVSFALGFHIVPYSAPEFPTIELLNHALTNYTSGRLVKRLVKETGLFSNIFSYMDRTKDPGLWMIFGDLETDKMDEAFSALFTELSKMVTEGLSPAELESAKGELSREYKSSRESFFRRAESLCLYELTSNLSLEGLYTQRISAVDEEKIDKAAERFLRLNNATLSLVLPEGFIAPIASVWADRLRVKVEEPVTSAQAVIPPEEIQLANGVVLLLQSDKSSEMASMEIYVRGGLWAEPEGQEGAADFLCRALTRGTMEMNGAEFAEITGKLGISLSAQAKEDFCRMSLNSTSDVFMQGVELAGLAFTRPGLRDDDIESIRREKLAEIRAIGDETYDMTRMEFNRLLYKNNPYQRPIMGYEKSVEKISRENLLDFHHKLFCGKNIIIAAAGNFNAGKVIQLTGEIFSEIEAGEQFAYKPQREHRPSKPIVEIIDKERAQTTYNLGWAAPSAKSEDYLPLTMALRILSSQMFFRFVYEEGICYRMWTRYTEMIGPGKFWFETGISPENYGFSKTEVLKEFNSFLKNPITEEMLSDAKRESLQTMKLGTETTTERARTLAKYYLLGYGPDYIYRFPYLINKISAKQVKKAAKKYLKPDGYSLLVVGKTK